MVDIYKPLTCGWILKHEARNVKVMQQVEEMENSKANEKQVDALDD